MEKKKFQKMLIKPNKANGLSLNTENEHGFLEYQRSVVSFERKKEKGWNSLCSSL